MYGDLIPGDTTHQDVILAYQNHFKSAHHSMPKKLGTRRDEEKFKVWEECAQTVQVVVFSLNYCYMHAPEFL